IASGVMRPDRSVRRFRFVVAMRSPSRRTANRKRRENIKVQSLERLQHRRSRVALNCASEVRFELLVSVLDAYAMLRDQRRRFVHAIERAQRRLKQECRALVIQVKLATQPLPPLYSSR